MFNKLKRIVFLTILITAPVFFYSCISGGAEVNSRVLIQTEVEGIGTRFGTPDDSMQVNNVRMVLGKSFFLGETDDDSLVYNDGFGQLTFSADGSTQFPIVGGPFQAGIYRSVSFNVLQAPDSEDSVIDDDFTQGNQRFSIIIDGTYNEEPFNFRSKQEFMNSFNFNPDLTVSQNNQRFVYTFVNNAQQWFRQANTLLDPRVEENRSKINERIGLGFDLDENTSEQQ
jgi:hypothetical protein